MHARRLCLQPLTARVHSTTNRDAAGRALARRRGGTHAYGRSEESIARKNRRDPPGLCQRRAGRADHGRARDHARHSLLPCGRRARGGAAASAAAAAPRQRAAPAHECSQAWQPSPAGAAAVAHREPPGARDRRSPARPRRRRAGRGRRRARTRCPHAGGAGEDAARTFRPRPGRDCGRNPRTAAGRFRR